jgi:hypothetical protein
MTPSEMEAELGSLRAQLSQLREQQDVRAAAWATIAVQCRVLAFVLIALAVGLYLLGAWLKDSSVTPLSALVLLQIFPLLYLRMALVTPVRKARA